MAQVDSVVPLVQRNLEALLPPDWPRIRAAAENAVPPMKTDAFEQFIRDLGERGLAEERKFLQATRFSGDGLGKERLPRNWYRALTGRDAPPSGLSPDETKRAEVFGGAVRAMGDCSADVISVLPLGLHELLRPLELLRDNALQAAIVSTHPESRRTLGMGVAAGALAALSRIPAPPGPRNVVKAEFANNVGEWTLFGLKNAAGSIIGHGQLDPVDTLPSGWPRVTLKLRAEQDSLTVPALRSVIVAAFETSSTLQGVAAFRDAYDLASCGEALDAGLQSAGHTTVTDKWPTMLFTARNPARA
jgi:hypothetical protein